MNDYNQLLSDLKCPNCGNFMQPPIRLCATGHSFCDQCAGVLKTCTLCDQALLATSRNFALEKLWAKCRFPCRNRERGCDYSAVGEAIRQHEKVCLFKNVQCPLLKEQSCRWLGSGVEALQHCLTTHPNETYTTPHTHFKFDNYTSRIHRSVFGCMFHVYGQLFKFVYDNHVEAGKTRWCVLLLSSQDEDYDFEVNIANENYAGQTLAIRGPCPAVALDDSQDAYEKFGTSFMQTNFPYVKSFCKTADLFYNVKIIKRDANDNH